MASSTSKIDFDPYEVLKIEFGASKKEIKKAYRKLAVILHPDKADEKDKKKAEEAFHQLKKAYDFLSDQEKKDQYDREGRAKLLQQKEREAKLAQSSATRKRFIEELEKRENLAETKKTKHPKHSYSEKDLHNFRQQNKEFLDRHNFEVERRRKEELAKQQEKLAQTKPKDINLEAMEEDILGDLLS